MGEIAEIVQQLLAEGKTPEQIHIQLEHQGYAGEDIASALSIPDRNHEERRNSRLLATRELFDRIGYGGATPQFVNILFWLSLQASPIILFLVGLLNGARALLSVILSNLLQEYHVLHRIGKNAIATAGVIFGFSFLFMSFGLLAKNAWIFSGAFLLAAVGVVAYGDLYTDLTRSLVKRERMGLFLRSMAHWGVLVTAVVLIISGFLLDAFPMSGTPWTLELFGQTYHLRVYGYLLAFEITAFSLIIAAYITSLMIDKREDRTYGFMKFLREHHSNLRAKIRVTLKDRDVQLMTLAGIVTGLLQILITAYSGIAMYRLVQPQTASPFLLLAEIYAIAILASFTGPFFTQLIHRSTGLAPTMVFGTLLTAIFPFALYLDAPIPALTAALCLHVIGLAITGFGQGLLAQKLMSDTVRRDYFRAQSYLITLPYILLVPLLAWAANTIPLAHTFMGVGLGLVAVVMPLYFWLVVRSQHRHL